MQNILEKSLSLKFAVVKRKKKFIALEINHIMDGDKIMIWVKSMLQARLWRGAFMYDDLGIEREYSPTGYFYINPYQVGDKNGR